MILLFVPISVGLMDHFDAYRDNALPIMASAVGGTLIVLVSLSWFLDRLLSRGNNHVDSNFTIVVFLFRSLGASAVRTHRRGNPLLISIGIIIPILLFFKVFRDLLRRQHLDYLHASACGCGA
ncbi:CidA/LrgA family protein [Vibrio lentus]|nr:CidA/LrgA family protein [Vibrio lentus]